MVTLVQERQTALLGALYAEDFDAPKIVPSPAPAPPPEPESKAPVFTVADMESAHAAGRAAARNESAISQAALRLKLLGQIASAIAASEAACTAAAAETAEAAARTMLSALAACLPALCAAHGETELRALVRAVLPSLVDEKRITIRLNPAMIPGIAAEIASLEPAIAACTVMVPVESMAQGDVQMAWQDGSATRDGAKIRAAVEDALAELGLLGPRLHEQEMLDA